MTTTPPNSLTHDQIRNFSPSPNCLDGKTILVTGAGDGIGQEVAMTYVKYGATVLLLGRTTSKLETVSDDITQAGGQPPAVITMDLETASQAEMQDLASRIEQDYGKIDGLLHNAGILGDITPLAEYDLSTFERVMRINFTSNFMLTQALLPLLKRSDNGSVIFTTSSVGSKPRALWGAYALSKQGVEGMSEIFTQETAKTTENKDTNLRFNCINPGGTRTDMRAKAYPDENPSRLKTPADIMAGYVCLMSDASIDVRGQVVDLQPK